MKLHPETYRAHERAERRRVLGRALLAGVVTLVVALLLINTVETRVSVNEHSTELNQTRALATSTNRLIEQVARVQAADTGVRTSEAHDLTEVANYAQQLTADVDNNHAASVANQEAICRTLNGITTQLHLSAVSCSLPNP